MDQLEEGGNVPTDQLAEDAHDATVAVAPPTPAVALPTPAVVPPIRRARDLEGVYTNLRYFCVSDGCQKLNHGKPKEELYGGKSHKCKTCSGILKEQCKKCTLLFSKGKSLRLHDSRNCKAQKWLIVFSFGNLVLYVCCL